MRSFPKANILDVDLTNQVVNRRALPGEVYRLYPGGSALGLYLLLQELKPNVEALAPENILVMAVSPLSGLPISGLNRMAITTKSPLTGGIGDSQAGGYFPVEIKANGWDAVMFRGKSQKPVYLYIEGDKTELRDAGAAWGKITGESERLIREDLGEDDLHIAQIGPAGENLVRYASIINMCSRANGRNGTGAVMGSKNLKAVAVKKGEKQKPKDKTKFKELAEGGRRRIKINSVVESLAEHGTDSALESLHLQGFLVTRN